MWFFGTRRGQILYVQIDVNEIESEISDLQH